MAYFRGDGENAEIGFDAGEDELATCRRSRCTPASLPLEVNSVFQLYFDAFLLVSLVSSDVFSSVSGVFNGVLGSSWCIQGSLK